MSTSKAVSGAKWGRHHPLRWIATSRHLEALFETYLVYGNLAAVGVAVYLHKIWPIAVAGVCMAANNFRAVVQAVHCGAIGVLPGFSFFAQAKRYTRDEMPWNYWAATAWLAISGTVFLCVAAVLFEHPEL